MNHVTYGVIGATYSETVNNIKIEQALNLLKMLCIESIDNTFHKKGK